MDVNGKDFAKLNYILKDAKDRSSEYFASYDFSS